MGAALLLAVSWDRVDVAAPILQRLSDGWDPEKPAESLPLPSALCEGGSFLDALTEPSRGQKRVMCYVTRKRGVRASFGFHLQLPPGMGDLQCFSARRHVLGRARGLCYTISLHRTVVAEVWYDADGNFSLVERRGGAAAGAAPPSKASPSKASRSTALRATSKPPQIGRAHV